jgi:ADP-ribose diphosphatase
MKWELINRESVYSGFFNVDKCHIKHELYEGGEIEIQRELLYRGDAVAVLLYDPAKDKVVMIEQFRVGGIDDQQNDDKQAPWLLEIVAGMVEKNESITDVARRECKEEAGLTVHSFETIYSYYSSPGGCSEKIYLMCGLVDSGQAGGIYGLDHEHEDIKVSVYDFDEIHQLLVSDRISSATPIIALQWLSLNRERLRIESFVL